MERDHLRQTLEPFKKEELNEIHKLRRLIVFLAASSGVFPFRHGYKNIIIIASTSRDHRG